jgi:CBS domain-containing protein
MRSLRVAHVMHAEVEAVRLADPFRTVVDYFLRYRFNYMYVVDDDQRFLGVIAFHGMKKILDQTDSLEMVIAQDLLDPNFETVTPDDSLADTMERFWKQNSERLPVVDSYGSGRLVGWISKRDLIAVYKQEILGEGQMLSRFGQAGDRGGKNDRYVELPRDFELAEIEVNAAMAGRTLRDLNPRGTHGVHVLQVVRYDPTRGTRTIRMPGPDSALSAADRLVVVGPVEGVDRFRAGDVPPAKTTDS